MKKCRHKYKPRYNRKWTTVLEQVIDKLKEFKLPNSAGTPYMCEETYIYDICVKCGDVKK